MKNAKTVNVGNGYYSKSFEKLCSLLEQGEAVHPYVDCIGHSLNNATQESYKRQLVKKYGERLIIEENLGCCRYSYNYKLK